ncbi:MAG: SGNH/GDSL hydrolase family protein [Parvularculaceae bacterium]|nr:SGNH/GDSL hydrolase family protein [Parvularculaceae bacterium]
MSGQKTDAPSASRSGFGLGAVLCALPAAYFGVAASYAVVNFSDFGGAVPQFIRYILAPTAIAGALLWTAFRAGRSTALIVGVNACAVMTALFLYEGFATYRLARSAAAIPNAPENPHIAELGVERALPPRATLRRLNRAIGGDVSLATAFLGGVPHENALLCVRPDGGLVTYKADKYGFNNPNAVYDAGILDIAVLGDSFVEGMCQKAGEDVAALLRKSGRNAASLGFRGNGPLIEYATLGRFGPSFRPKLTAILYYAGNDSENLETEIETPWLRNALAPGADFGELSPSAGQIDAARRAVAGFWGGDGVATKTYEARLWRNFFAMSHTSAVLGLHYPATPKALPQYEAVLKKMRELTGSWGGDVVVLYVPRAERFRGALPNEFAFRVNERHVTDAASRAGVDVINLASEFKRQGDPRSFYASDGHFSEKGAALAARLIAERAAAKDGTE